MKASDVYDRVIAIIESIALLRDPAKKTRDRTYLKRRQRKSESDVTLLSERTFDIFISELRTVNERRVNHANAQNRILSLDVIVDYSMTDEHDTLDKRVLGDFEQIQNAFILTGARTNAYTGKSVSSSATDDVYQIIVQPLSVEYDSESELVESKFKIQIEYMDTNPQNT